MSRLSLLLALSSGATVTAVAWAIVRPPRRLHKRVRRYGNVARARLLRSVEPDAYLAATKTPVTIRNAFTPVLEQLTALQARLIGPADEAQLAVRLRQSGLYPGTDPDERLGAYRTRTLAMAALAAVALGFVGWQTQGPTGLILYGVGGFVVGSFIARGRVDKAIKQRRQRAQSELYTINQVLAMRARTGGGVADALRHIAQRGRGIIATEIREILRLSRSGLPITDALRKVASTTVEPEAARLYQSLAIAHERGVDLADTLLALSRDLRIAKRDEAVTKAASRRIMAIVPIVVILAPIAIAFMAAPLPSLIFGGGTP